MSSEGDAEAAAESGPGSTPAPGAAAAEREEVSGRGWGGGHPPGGVPEDKRQGRGLGSEGGSPGGCPQRGEAAPQPGRYLQPPCGVRERCGERCPPRPAVPGAPAVRAGSPQPGGGCRGKDAGGETGPVQGKFVPLGTWGARGACCCPGGGGGRGVAALGRWDNLRAGFAVWGLEGFICSGHRTEDIPPILSRGLGTLLG